MYFVTSRKDSLCDRATVSEDTMGIKSRCVKDSHQLTEYFVLLQEAGSGRRPWLEDLFLAQLSFSGSCCMIRNGVRSQLARALSNLFPEHYNLDPFS